MADDINQGTVDAAGLTSPALEKEITRVGAERSADATTKAKLLEQQQASLGEQEKTLQERSAAAQPIRDQMAAATTPSAKVQEEEIPRYERPKMDPKEMQSTMAVLTIATALIGAASRTPFFGAMEGMKGAMEGFNAADEQKVKESVTAYDKNVAAIKANNEAKRREVQAAITDNQNDIGKMKRQLELTLVKYDDQINLQALRTQPINEALKRIQEREKQDDTLMAHLLQTQASLRSWQFRPGRAPGGAGRGVTPTGPDVKNATGIIANDERFADMDEGALKAFATAAASIAKSLTISKEADNFDEGMDMAIDQLVKEGRVKPGKDKAWGWVPFTGSAPKFGAAGAQAEGGGELKRQALDAIANGKDPVLVKKRYKEMTGEDLPDGGV